MLSASTSFQQNNLWLPESATDVEGGSPPAGAARRPVAGGGGPTRAA